ncbi:MAG: CYTH domain-containing protein [Maricaulaceae bacterium]|jgi:CYTH domain-containing protein
MAQEIERKFLVVDDDWRASVRREITIRQAYLASGDGAEVRIRITNGSRAQLAVKTRRTKLSRDEFEYDIPLADAEALLPARLGEVIDKRRHEVEIDGAIWEVDVYAGPLEGLVTAEIELTSESQKIDPPPWLGAEVTGDPRYANATLAREGLPRS